MRVVQVRDICRAGADKGQLMASCDKLRDETLVDLGIRSASYALLLFPPCTPHSSCLLVDMLIPTLVSCPGVAAAASDGGTRNQRPEIRSRAENERNLGANLFLAPNAEPTGSSRGPFVCPPEK